jgi:hypothetical protein
MSKELTDQFHQEMLGIYDAALKLKPPYRAKQFLIMVQSDGGKATADKLLATAKPSQGFTELYLRGPESLKLSLEYLVLKSPWRSLFTEEQLAKSRKRLKDVNCASPEDDAN